MAIRIDPPPTQSWVQQPDGDVEFRTSQPFMYHVGDRIDLPDGRRGVVRAVRADLTLNRPVRIDVLIRPLPETPMTESEWLTADLPRRMLRHLERTQPAPRFARKLHQFYAAHGDGHADKGAGPRWVAEYSERGMGPGEWPAESVVFLLPVGFTLAPIDTPPAERFLHADAAWQAGVLRELWGNPWRLPKIADLAPHHALVRRPSDGAALIVERERLPFKFPRLDNLGYDLGTTVEAISPSVLTWQGGTVPRLAAAIRDRADLAALPVLADALEEAGCADETILGHLRSPGPHLCGCWCLDLTLGES